MKAVFVLVVVGLVTASAAAQTPTVVNGTLDVRALNGSLEREFDGFVSRASNPVWVGYSVTTRGRGDGGCWTSGDGFTERRRVGPVKLEGPESLYVLYRIADKAVGQIRFASAECPLDAGGLTVHWLTGVTDAASINWLNRYLEGTAPRKLANQAVVAIALHGDPVSLERLLTLARDGKDRQVRSDALFWVAQRAGAKAMETISTAIERDPDTEVKKRAVFALSQMPKDEGVPKLIDVARTHANVEVRRQAMFWLGQSGDPRALRFFEDVLKK
jgi:hypothetical protein